MILNLNVTLHATVHLTEGIIFKLKKTYINLPFEAEGLIVAVAAVPGKSRSRLHKSLLQIQVTSSSVGTISPLTLVTPRFSFCRCPDRRLLRIVL